MKKTLLLLLFAALSTQAQTTHDLDWEMGIGTNLDLTINVGDIVKWTWTDTFSHTVESEIGSTETFNSGTKTGIGNTFSYQFNIIGTNPYKCGFHPFTMGGTITVQSALSIETFSIKDFSLSPNPAYNNIVLKLPDGISIESIFIFDLLGHEIYKSNGLENTIDISKLNKGLYFLNINSSGNSHTKKFIKL